MFCIDKGPAVAGDKCVNRSRNCSAGTGGKTLSVSGESPGKPGTPLGECIADAEEVDTVTSPGGAGGTRR